MDMFKQITLKNLMIDANKYIGFQFHPDKVIHALLKEFDGLKWSKEYSMVYIKNTKTNVNAIFAKFRGVAWINCKYFFNNKPLIDKGITPDTKQLRKRKLSNNHRRCPEEYINKLEIKKYSINTIRIYVNCFEAFINYYKDVELKQINENDIRTYILHIIEKKYSISYQNQMINAIKFYYELVLGMPNRFYAIERPKKKDKLPLVLSKEEIRSIINNTENLKHKAILITLYSCGLRISEVLNLKITDIHSDRSLVSACKKTGEFYKMICF